jgi:capsular polysaccharide biosynthesis protein
MTTGISHDPDAELATLPRSIRPSRTRSTVLRAVIATLLAVVVAIATYFIASGVTATYQSSSQLRVIVNEATGLGSDSITASNQLTAQLVQLVPTDAILTPPAATLGMSVSSLRSNISAGSVAQQNLLQITADGPSAGGAQQRAALVTRYFVSYVTQDAHRQLGIYVTNLSKQLQSVNNTYARLAARLRTAHGNHAAVLQGELGSIVQQQQSLRTQITQRASAGLPVIQTVQAAGAGSKVSPRPVLYAIVALVVAAFIAAQVVVLAERRRRSSL